MKILSSDSPINTSDRAFNYGDGVFTTILVNGGKPQLIALHVERVVNDANRLGIRVETELLRNAITTAAKQIAEEKAVLKVHVSAGEGGRGYARSPETSALVRFSVGTYPSHYDALKSVGMSLICAKTALALQPALAGLKHMNRLEQVLVMNEIVALQSASSTHIHDALVSDTNGNLIETSVGNLFWRKGQKWFTPKLDECGVNGVMRQLLIKYLGLKGIETQEVKVPLTALKGASTLVVTNALMGIMPVKHVLDQNLMFEQSVSAATSLNESLQKFVVSQSNEEAVNEVS